MADRWKKEAQREGQRFGRLVVVEYMGIQSKRPYYRLWKCRCDCGKEKITTARALVAGHTRSCGCLFKETLRARAGNNRLPKGQAAANSLFYNYQKSAKQRKIEWRLSKKKFLELTSGNCHYCGTPPDKIWWGNSEKNCNGYYAYIGIDRIDNTKGYLLGNVVSCCTHCNVAKACMTQDEFFGWIRSVFFYSVWGK